MDENIIVPIYGNNQEKQVRTITGDERYSSKGMNIIVSRLGEVVDYINKHHETIELIEAGRRLGKLDDLINAVKGSQ